MSQAYQLPNIAHCRAGKVTDQVLDQVTVVAGRAQQGHEMTEAEAALILLTAPQICDELRQRRAAMDLISDVMDLDNVRFFPCQQAAT